MFKESTRYNILFLLLFFSIEIITTRRRRFLLRSLPRLSHYPPGHLPANEIRWHIAERLCASFSLISFLWFFSYYFVSFYREDSQQAIYNYIRKNAARYNSKVSALTGVSGVTLISERRSAVSWLLHSKRLAEIKVYPRIETQMHLVKRRRELFGAIKFISSTINPH